MRYINLEIFWLTFGFLFSIPHFEDIFLQYIAPELIKNSSDISVSLIIFVVWCIVFLSSFLSLFDVIRKIIKMRGILTNNPIRNIAIAIVLGIILGYIAQRAVS